MLRSIVALIMFALAIAATWISLHPIALPESRTLKVQEDDWHLPSRSKLDTSALVGTIERDKLWGTLGATGPVDEKPLSAPNWRIVGVVSAGAESYAMLAVDGEPIQQIKTGEKLPGGIKIVNMTADRVCILLNGKKRVLKTYKE